MAHRLSLGLVSALALSLLGGSINAQPAPTQTPRAPSSSFYSFTFEDADLKLVADEVLGRVLGIGYSIDSGVDPKVTFRIDQRLTKVQLLDAFEAALALRDVVLVRQGERLLITSRTRARGAVSIGSEGISSGGGYQLLRTPLAFASPSEVSKGLQALGLGGLVVMADDATRTVVLGGTSQELAAAKDAVALLDKNKGNATRFKLIELHNAGANSVAAELLEVLKSAGVGGVQVTPLDRLRSLLLFAPSDELLSQAQLWVARLDAAPAKDQGALWIYKPKNVSAEALSQTLNDVLGDGSETSRSEITPARPSSTETTLQRPISQTQPIRSTAPVKSSGVSEVRIAVDRDSNSLLISAPPSRRPEIQNVLDQIDVLPRQILIEASILEVTLGNEFRLGVNWSVLANNGRVKIVQTDNNVGQIAPSFPGLGVTYLGNEVSAAIDALRARTNVKVLSAPKLVVLDNRQARLQIGDQVPIAIETTQSVVSADSPRLVSIDYRNTGVILEVTPRITGQDGVTLTISQEVSSVARTTTSGIDSPTIRQRRFDSVLLVKTGSTVALGGLISSSDTTDSSGIPELERTPILGHLFKSQARDRRRTELIVLMTARILPDDNASAGAAASITSGMKAIAPNGLKAP